MSKYDQCTPGPWKFHRDDEHYTRFYVSQENGAPYTSAYSDVASLIAETVSGERIAIQQANAQLIADAPMLLDQRDRLLSLIKLIAPEMRGLALVSPDAKSLAKMIDTLIADIEATK